MGLFEIHCHTSETSICGKVKAGDMVRLHKDAGFEGLCITDHYNEYHFETRFKRNSENFLIGYRIAREHGEKIGLKVLFGIEYRFAESPNDYLLYGVDEDFVIRNPCMHELTLKEFRDRCMDDKMLLIQAHPMRDGMEYVDLSLLDGMEVVNGNERHRPRNAKVRRYAAYNKLVMTSASDFHRESDLLKAPMDFENEINDIDDLISEIRAGRYSLIDNTKWNK